MINLNLLEKLNNYEMVQMGFVHDTEDDDPRGHSWNIETDNFKLSIDAYGEVILNRKNPDTDQITVLANDLSDLQTLIDWIND